MKYAISELSQLKQYHIDTSRSDVGIKEESPDFILKSQNGDIIGIEHFLVDTLFNKQSKETKTKYHSYSRQYPSKVSKLIEEYGNNKYKENKECALKDLSETINEKFSYQTNFNFDSFIQYFLQTVHNHEQNIETYKNCQDGYGNNIARLGFICEIRTDDTTDYIWKVYDKKWYEQKIIGIPMTDKMWKCIHHLLTLKKIDFFIITAISQNNKSKSIYLDIDSKSGKIFKKFEYPLTNIERKVNHKLTTDGVKVTINVKEID